MTDDTHRTPPSLMLVFAHPDDESFATGGVAALASDRGIPVRLVTATAGDAGRDGGLASTADGLAAVRTAELERACALLGIREHVVLGYGDGRLAEAPFEDAVARVCALVREWRPSVVVTFGREGAGNSHRDHRTICRIATAAVLAAGDPLAYPKQRGGSLAPHAVAKLYVVSAKPGVLSRDGDPFETPTTRVDVSAVRTRKLAAFAVHASQASLVEKLEEWMDANGNAEFFARVLCRVPVPTGLETDLFSGLEDD
jgi:LmbE family N-acetylglucosaminyl deacetylase